MKTGVRNGKSPKRIHALSLQAAAVLLASAIVSVAVAQNIQPASSGAVQGVKAGVTQRVTTGSIARSAAGEGSGTDRFGVSETTGRVVSGKVAGYGKRQITGGLGEYSGMGRSGFSSSRDFPTTDFVGTMPQPALSFAPSSAPAGANGFGLTLPPPRPAASAHKAAPHPQFGVKDPEAILNPFSHATMPTASLPTGMTGTSGSIH